MSEGQLFLLVFGTYFGIGIALAFPYYIYQLVMVEEEKRDEGTSFALLILWPLIIGLFAVFSIVVVVGKFCDILAENIKRSRKAKGLATCDDKECNT